MSKYKTLREYEVEKAARDRKWHENARRRQEEKRARGFECRREFNEHTLKHKEEKVQEVKKLLRSILIGKKKGILLDEVDTGGLWTVFLFILIAASSGVQKSGRETHSLAVTWLQLRPVHGPRHGGRGGSNRAGGRAEGPARGP